ncbi:hypothetical protein D3C86_1335510 [compost metagenome]
MVDSAPKDFILSATFNGAPPIFLWVGNTSHKTSPNVTALTLNNLIIFSNFNKLKGKSIALPFITTNLI